MEYDALHRFVRGVSASANSLFWARWLVNHKQLSLIASTDRKGFKGDLKVIAQEVAMLDLTVD